MSRWLMVLVRRATAPTCVLMPPESAGSCFPRPSRARVRQATGRTGEADCPRLGRHTTTEVTMSIAPARPVVDDPDDRAGTRDDALDGVRATLPILAAYAPLGLVVGAAVASSDNPWAAWLGTFAIYGGAAQLAVLDVLAHDPGWVTAAVVGALVNLRLAAYATAMVPVWRTASWRRRVAA